MFNTDPNVIWSVRIHQLLLLHADGGLRVPWAERRSNWLILEEISPEYSLEGLTKAEAPILWPPDEKNWLFGKDPDVGKHWRWEEKGMTEDEMVGWRHRLNGHQFEQATRVGDGQGSLACCSSQGGKELDTTERLDWIDRGYCRVVTRRLWSRKSSWIRLCPSCMVLWSWSRHGSIIEVKREICVWGKLCN